MALPARHICRRAPDPPPQRNPRPAVWILWWRLAVKGAPLARRPLALPCRRQPRI